MSALAWRGAGLVVVVALIALWREIAALKLVSPIFLPTPARVWMALEHGFLHATLGAKLAGTVSHMLGGWVVASIVGVGRGS
jgi:sulfonate transport system permease protein